MRTVLIVVGVLVLMAWLAVAGSSIYGLVITNRMSQAAGPLVTHLGYAWDADSWKEHWMFHNSYTLICGLLGCLGAILLVRLKPIGFLIEAIASLLWFLLPYGLAIFGLRRFGYEFVRFGSNVQLLGLFIAFTVGYLVITRRVRAADAQKS
ncbi:hypothetical protein DWU98_06785 [Dyella monticola]|uniref:Uncharacterized protein n=1 Tax=Dyella monticola TaxID=1927958 RepID=A0A370X357_9GAMM|nr:hypothetical protein DWU98_06785 [Dyella monticola]